MKKVIKKASRKLNRPLTLEEIRERYTSNNELYNCIGFVGYAQEIGDYFGDSWWCLHILAGCCDYVDGKLVFIWNASGDSDDCFCENTYGNEWVLWDHIPSKKEMMMAHRGTNEEIL